MSGLIVEYPTIGCHVPIAAPPYAELMVTGNFSFLRGGSHGEELLTRAVALGLNGMGLADRNSFAGVVKPFTALRDLRDGDDPDLAALAKRFRFAVGTRLCFADGTPDILAYPTDRAAFGRLCKLLTTGNRRAKKGECILRFSDLLAEVPAHEELTDASTFASDTTPSTVTFPRKRGSPFRTTTSCFDKLTKRSTESAEDVIPSPSRDEVRAPPVVPHPTEEPERFTDGQLLIVHIDEANFARGEETLRTLASRVHGRVWLAAACTYTGDDRARLNRLADLARRAGVPLLAVNDVLYHEPGRRPLQDVVTCIREHLTIATAGRRLEKNAERHIKAPAEMARLFREHPDAIAETQRLFSQLTFDLSHLRYNYPAETVGNGETAQQTLERLTWAGAKKRYSGKKWPGGIPYMVKRGVVRELRLIADKGYAPYFLTVHDIVQFARHERKILCQGRGSAANSMVCYCLEITEVEPTVGNLVFGRFLSTERHEPPDIDVDFEHERREEVMQYLYTKYSRERCGLTATVVTYRSKGALREVSKVFGLSTDTIEAMNGMSWGWYSLDLSPERVKELGFDPNEPTLRKTIEIARELMGFPRHLSQHVGGFVITRDQLDFLVPISNAAMEDRTVIEWDKNDIEALEILKVDVLALGMLTCIRRAFDMMHVHYGMDLTLQGILDEEREDLTSPLPWDDRPSSRVYKMTHRADTLGVFQIESRAQMSMLPRLRPMQFYDLVIEVAIVRPGPIQGGMVHPYLKRRMGLEEIPTYPNPKLEKVLGRTYGVPLFQEQAMQIATEGAGFTAGEADRLRRAMATWKHNGKIDVFRERFMQGMHDNGYDAEFADRCFKQIEGFGEYGFPESHSASFALLVYVSCWLKCHYPDVFACALLNSQPMGFYAPAQIVRDAREHGVEVLDVDVNLSDWLHVLEPGTPATPRIWDRHAEMREDIRSTHAIRLGLSQISGLKEDHAGIIVARRGNGYTSIRDLWLRTGLPIATLQKLADADAFGTLGLNRREASWAIRGLIGTDGAETLPLFKSAGLPAPRRDTGAGLPEMSPGESVVHDYSALSLSLRAHPVSFVRGALEKRRTLRCADLEKVRDGTWVEVAGLVLVRQRPGTASGVIFATLEDETGIANIVIWNRVFDANRRVVLTSRMLAVRGKLQTDGRVIHVIAQAFTDLTPMLIKVAQGHQLSPATLSPADEGREGLPRRSGRDEPKLRHEERMARQARAALPSGRNFH